MTGKEIGANNGGKSRMRWIRSEGESDEEDQVKKGRMR